MSKTVPDWVLSEDWGASIDNYNCILLRRSRNKKTNKPTTWTAISFYPTFTMLFEGLLRKASRTNTGEPDLIKHIEHALSVSQSAYRQFLEEINSNPSPDVEKAEKRLAARRSNPR